MKETNIKPMPEGDAILFYSNVTVRMDKFKRQAFFVTDADELLSEIQSLQTPAGDNSK